MPVEIKNIDEFIKITERAIECRVVKNTKRNLAKIKARTKRYLYVIKVPLDQLDAVLGKLKCQINKTIDSG
ncbi:MAG: 5'-nucleotidase [Desulfurococcaceae archaeon]